MFLFQTCKGRTGARSPLKWSFQIWTYNLTSRRKRNCVCVSKGHTSRCWFWSPRRVVGRVHRGCEEDGLDFGQSFMIPLPVKSTRPYNRSPKSSMKLSCWSQNERSVSVYDQQARLHCKIVPNQQESQHSGHLFSPVHLLWSLKRSP